MMAPPVTSDERWLAAIWPLVRSALPAPPASVVDLGCGSLGGFVPSLLADGYDAVGVDPQAPGGRHYRQLGIEQAELPWSPDAVVACTSLHHVDDPGAVLELLGRVVVPAATLVVVEWASERFDEETAAWCFDRLADGEEGWLHRRRDEWLASGRDWATFLRDWAEDHHVHAGEAVVRHLDERLERRHLAFGPYFFSDLADTTMAEEQSAIDEGRIRATRIDWVGEFV